MLGGGEGPLPSNKELESLPGRADSLLSLGGGRKQWTMQLLDTDGGDKLQIKDEIKPERFRDWHGGSGRESDIDSLVLRYPGLLNLNNDFDPNDSSNDEILILGAQATNRKKSRFVDFLGLDTDGTLVVIEDKRDDIDETNRNESIEWQSIRYAASCVKMTYTSVLDLFKQHLRKTEGEHHLKTTEDAYLTSVAEQRMSEHLEVDRDSLSEHIALGEGPKIYLVAASYDEAALSAVAWLRSHGIAISAFQLQPYTIGDRRLIGRERLIPPPELDDYMDDPFYSASPSQQIAPRGATGGVVRKAPTNKPTRLQWSDTEDEVELTSWRDLLENVTIRALGEGLSPDLLPMKWTKSKAEKAKMQSPKEVSMPDESDGGHTDDTNDVNSANKLYVEFNASSKVIQGFVTQIINTWNPALNVTVSTRNEETITLPGDGG